MNKFYIVVSLLIGIAASHPSWAAQSGKDVFSKSCSACHTAGTAGAPRLGNTADWAARIAKGVQALYQSTLNGTAKGMPARGGNHSLSDDEVKAAVDYMVAAVKVEEPKPAAKAEAKPVPSVPAAATPAPAATAAPVQAAPVNIAGSDPLSFNRLLKPASKRNLPPWEDGIHDPTNDGTHALLAPLSVFPSLPKANSGNRVDWVKALESGTIKPRADKTDPAEEMIVMDMNVVREVKGSMPNVVYPHKQHTEWLDCSNCHPGIFIPLKGANQISMAAIMLGNKCGVCHGRVAFSISECRKCHSQNKESNPAASTPK